MKDKRFTPVYDNAGIRCPDGTPCDRERCMADNCCIKAQSGMEAAFDVRNVPSESGG